MILHDHSRGIPLPPLFHPVLLEPSEDEDVNDEGNGNGRESRIQRVLVQVVEEVLVRNHLGGGDGGVDGDADHGVEARDGGDVICFPLEITGLDNK